MSNVEWVVEVGEVFHDGNDLANAIEKRKGTVHRVPTRCQQAIAWPRIDTSVVTVGFGSCNFVLQMSRQRTLCEGVLDFHNRLRCSHYYHHIYDLFRGYRVFMPAGALKHASMAVDRMFGNQVFIRPDSAIKPFDGRIYHSMELTHADSDPQLSRADGDMVVLASVVKFEKEYRVFCRDGKAIGHSSYMPLDAEWQKAPDEVVAFAEEAAKRLIEPVGSMVVVDVGTHISNFQRVSKNEVKEEKVMSLVEINGVCSSGFYGCDLDAYIEAMEAEAVSRRFD